MKIVPDLCNPGLRVEREKDPNEPAPDVETWWERQQARNRASFERFLPIVVIVIFVLFALPRLVTTSKGTAGPDAPWSQQLAAAERAMSTVDRDHAIVGIKALPAMSTGESYYHRGADIRDALEVTFSFVAPHAHDLGLSLVDTDPTGTVSKPVAAIYWDTSPAELELLRKKVAGVRVSPREAERTTWPYVNAFLKQNNFALADLSNDPQIELLMDTDFQKCCNLATSEPAVWKLTYVVKGNIFIYYVHTGTAALLGRQLGHYTNGSFVMVALPLGAP